MLTWCIKFANQLNKIVVYQHQEKKSNFDYMLMIIMLISNIYLLVNIEIRAYYKLMISKNFAVNLTRYSINGTFKLTEKLFWKVSLYPNNYTKKKIFLSFRSCYILWWIRKSSHRWFHKSGLCPINHYCLWRSNDFYALFAKASNWRGNCRFYEYHSIGCMLLPYQCLIK